MIAVIFLCVMKSHLFAMFMWNFTTTSLSIAQILFFYDKTVENCRFQHCQLTHAYCLLTPCQYWRLGSQHHLCGSADFIFGQNIQRVHPNKSPLKFSEKRECGHIQGLHNFFGYPLLSHTTNFKSCTHIYSLNRPLKILRKVAMGVVRDSQKFSGHPYIGRIARSSLRQLSFLVLTRITYLGFREFAKYGEWSKFAASIGHQKLKGFILHVHL